MSPMNALSISGWHTRSGDEAARLLHSERNRGLGAAEVLNRLRENGPNRLPEAERESAARRFFKHFRDLFIYIMLFGAAAAAVMDHYPGTIAILIVVGINAIIGFVQENKAESALAGIRSMLALQAHVVRDGVRNDIDATGLTLGDIVYLKPGDKVPADIRLLHQVARFGKTIAVCEVFFMFNMRNKPRRSPATSSATVPPSP